MRRTMVTGMVVLALAVPAAANAATNQGDPSKVIAVDLAAVPAGCTPTAAPKVDVASGTVLDLWTADLVTSVSIKTGTKAAVVSAIEEQPAGQPLYHVRIELTKDLSNYVVSTCPAPAPGDGGGSQ